MVPDLVHRPKGRLACPMASRAFCSQQGPVPLRDRARSCLGLQPGPVWTCLGSATALLLPLPAARPEPFVLPGDWPLPVASHSSQGWAQPACLLASITDWPAPWQGFKWQFLFCWLISKGDMSSPFGVATNNMLKSSKQVCSMGGGRRNAACGWCYRHLLGSTYTCMLCVACCTVLKLHRT